MAAKKIGKNKAALLDMMGEHAGNVNVGASNEGLALISSLAQAQYDAAVKVAELEDQLKDAKKELAKVSEVDLPEAMKECGVKDFTTTTGLKITLKDDLNVGITEAKREEAYSWLRDNGFDGLIKSDLALHFDRDHLKDAEKLVAQLGKKGYDVEFKQNIHYQTLKAFVKERMADTEADVQIPLDLFGARPYQVAVVKPGKK